MEALGAGARESNPDAFGSFHKIPGRFPGIDASRRVRRLGFTYKIQLLAPDAYDRWNFDFLSTHPSTLQCTCP
jgi:hypothetical protein